MPRKPLSMRPQAVARRKRMAEKKELSAPIVIPAPPAPQAIPSAPPSNVDTARHRSIQFPSARAVAGALLAGGLVAGGAYGASRYLDSRQIADITRGVEERARDVPLTYVDVNPESPFELPPPILERAPAPELFGRSYRIHWGDPMIEREHLYVNPGSARGIGVPSASLDPSIVRISTHT